MKQLLLSFITLILFVACETGHKWDNNESVNFSYKHKPKASYIPIDKEPLSQNTNNNNIDIEEIDNGLDIGTIRTSETKNHARLVFDSYKWNDTTEYLGDKVNEVGSYTFDYDPDRLLITVVLHGYRAFSAELPKFSSKSIVEKIYLDKYLDDNGYKFYIKLRYDSEVKLFDLKNPGRIVVDISLL